MRDAEQWIDHYLASGFKLVQLFGVDEAGNCLCGRTDADHRKGAGKHPPHSSWQERGLGTRDAAIEAWRLDPRANVGIVTGAPSGVWVLDVDPDNGGDDRLAELIAAHGELPPTRVHRTGSGGQHYFWRMPADGAAVTNARGALPRGLDVRGTGGQVVAPPSLTAKGAYAVERATETLEAPAWLYAIIRAKAAPVLEGMPANVSAANLPTLGVSRLASYVQSAVQLELAPLALAREGERNDAAFKAACALVELANSPWCQQLGFNRDHAWQAFAGAIHAQANPLPFPEAAEVWQKAERRVAGRGRELPALPEVGFQGLSTSELVDVARAELTAQAAAQAAATGLPAGEVDPVGEFVGSWLSSEDLEAIELPEPLVDGYLFVDSLAWIIGPSRSAKSFVAIDMALSIATGRAWQGHDVREGFVLYLAAEGVRGIRQRVRAWEKHHYSGARVSPDRFKLHRYPVQAADPVAWAVMVEAVKRTQPVMVILDTQARVTVGIDENSNSEMGTFVERLETLRRAAGACVTTVHHTNAAGTSRGATAILGAATTELTVAKAGDAVTITTTKQKDIEEPDKLSLRLEPVGESVVLIPGTALTDASLEAQARRVELDEDRFNDALRVLTDVMRDTFAEGRGGTKAEVRGQWERRMVSLGLAERADGHGLRRSYYRAWNRAAEHGLIVRVEGTQSYRARGEE